jgi:hypothetical protein
MYYLEDLSIKEIQFLKDLLETYKEQNTKETDGKYEPLSPMYHTLFIKIKRLCKFVSFNPDETNTPKQISKYRIAVDEKKKKYYRRVKEQ